LIEYTAAGESMNRLYALILVPVLILATACTKPGNEQTGSDSMDATADRHTFQDIVDDINENVSGMAMVAGTYASGDMTSEYRAYYDEDELRFIHEHLNMGEYGSSVNRYYFHNGTLLYTEEDKLSRGVSETGMPQTRAIVTWMVFDSTGAPIQSEMQVDGKPRAPDEAEAAMLVKHANELADAAAKSRDSSMHAGSSGPANN
jgi:hypothetical protein